MVYIWAEFHEACSENGQMDQILSALALTYKEKLKILKCNGEEDDISTWAETKNVEVVPTVLIFDSKILKKKIEGVNPVELNDSLIEIFSSNKTKTSPNDIYENIKVDLEREDLRKRIKLIINSAKIMVFMKGTKEEPKCKFSRELMSILLPLKYEFSTFNILDDDEVRQEIKVVSNWKTFPQVYINGKLIGGLDSIKNLISNGALDETLTNQKAFVPVTPILIEEKASEEDLNERLKRLVNKDKVVLFMKGCPEEPQCGFSRTIVGILHEHKINFADFDILQDNAVREGLKKFSNWPTFPQLYVDGDLIGGLDIVQEMASEGDLKNDLGLV